MDDYSSPSDNESVKRAMRNLIADMKVLASDTRELLRQTTGQSGEQFARLRERTRDTLTAVEQRLGPLQQRLAEHGRHAVKCPSSTCARTGGAPGGQSLQSASPLQQCSRGKRDAAG